MMEILPGVEIDGFPTNTQFLGVVMVIKTLDDEGDVAWHTRKSDGLNFMEELGALHAAQVVLENGVEFIETGDTD